jgi:hypothetical protein
MPYKIDPDVLHKVAKQVVGLRLEGGELISRATELLSDAYPALIDPEPGRWVGSKASHQAVSPLIRASRRKISSTRREKRDFASARRRKRPD